MSYQHATLRCVRTPDELLAALPPASIIRLTPDELAEGIATLPPPVLAPELREQLLAIVRDSSREGLATNVLSDAERVATFSFAVPRTVLVLFPDGVSEAHGAALISLGHRHVERLLLLNNDGGIYKRRSSIELEGRTLRFRSQFVQSLDQWERQFRYVEIPIAPAWEKCVAEWSAGLAGIRDSVVLPCNRPDARETAALANRLTKQLEDELTASLVADYLRRQREAQDAFREFGRTIEQDGSAPSYKRSIGPTDHELRVARYRAQARQTYPLVFWAINMGRAQQPAAAQVIEETLLRAVDEGQPLEPCIAKAFGVPPWTVRHLHRISPEAVACYTGHAMKLLRDLSRLSPDIAPDTAEGLRVLCELSNNFPPKSGFSVCLGRLDKRDRRVLHRLIETKGVAGVRDYAAFIDGIVDWLGKRVNSHQLVPDALMGRPSLSDWLRLSSRWHRLMFARRRAFLDFSLSEESHARWPALLAAPIYMDGWQFTSLNSKKDLVREGERMEHCVGTYDFWCVEGESFILALRGPHERLTVEVTKEGWGSHTVFDLAQVVGRGNRTASKQADQIVQRFIAALNERAIPVTREVMDQDLWIDATRELREQFNRSMGSGVDDFLLELKVNGRAAIEELRSVLEPQPGRGTLCSTLSDLFEEQLGP